MTSTLPKTKEGIIIKSRDALIKQGEPCTSATGGCLYRNNTGQACAVGVLISDKDAALLDTFDNGDIAYIAQFGDYENFTDMPDWDYLPESDFDTFQKLSPELKTFLKQHKETLETIQSIHDQYAPNQLSIYGFEERDFKTDINERFTKLLSC